MMNDLIAQFALTYPWDLSRAASLRKNLRKTDT